MKLLAFLGILFFVPVPQTVELTITTSVAQAGKMHLAVYNSSEGFKARAEVLSVVRTTSGAPVSLQVELPGAGDYVLAAFHDLNGNGELDVNMLGIPTEPYGFGQVPPSKWREPDFREIATSVVTGRANATIVLKKWKEY